MREREREREREGGREREGELHCSSVCPSSNMLVCLAGVWAEDFGIENDDAAQGYRCERQRGVVCV